jgi:hypothetical protein
MFISLKIVICHITIRTGYTLMIEGRDTFRHQRPFRMASDSTFHQTQGRVQYDDPHEHPSYVDLKSSRK